MFGRWAKQSLLAILGMPAIFSRTSTRTRPFPALANSDYVLILSAPYMQEANFFPSWRSSCHRLAVPSEIEVGGFHHAIPHHGCDRCFCFASSGYCCVVQTFACSSRLASFALARGALHLRENC